VKHAPQDITPFKIVHKLWLTAYHVLKDTTALLTLLTNSRKSSLVRQAVSAQVWYQILLYLNMTVRLDFTAR
jgi:hypothetical protein